MKTLPNQIVLILILLFAGTLAVNGQSLFEAIENHDNEAVKIAILQNPGAINDKNQAGNTPLIESIVLGFNDISLILIDAGADTKISNANGFTPLHVAANRNRFEIVEKLLHMGVDPNPKDRINQTPLILVARVTQNAQMARLLIEHGADLNAQDNIGSMPLNNAVTYGGDPELIDLLVSKGAQFDTTGTNWRYLVYGTASAGNAKLFKYIQGKSERSPMDPPIDPKRLLKTALGGGSIEIAQSLLDKGIPLDLGPNYAGWTPLHYAVANQHQEMVEFLVKQGADLKARTNDGRSAYNLANEAGNESLAQMLAKLGCDTGPQQFPSLTGPYFGQPIPSEELTLFAPGLIIIDHSAVNFSPDGTEMFWGTGTSIMTSRLEDEKWTQPDFAPFSGKREMDFYDDVPFITPDNRHLIFTSKRPIGTDSLSRKENIWIVDRIPGGWSEPRPVSPEINANGLHWQVTTSAKGNLYFGGSGKDCYGSSDIYSSQLINGVYQKPVNLGPVINSADGESMPFIAADESYLIYVKVRAQRPAPCISFRSPDGEWLPPVDISEYLGEAGCPQVSSDKRVIFIMNGRWRDAGFIEKLRPLSGKAK